MTASLKPFVCEQCRTTVRHTSDRRVISLDSTDQKTTHRYRRITLGRLCAPCCAAFYVAAESGTFVALLRTYSEALGASLTDGGVVQGGLLPGGHNGAEGAS